MRLLFGLALLALTGCERAPYVQQPPARYRNSNVATVRFVDMAQVAKDCASGEALACEAWLAITTPNPCQWPGGESYAQLMCHELAHVNGWPASHPMG